MRSINIVLIFCLLSVTALAREQIVHSSKEISNAIWSPLTEIEINTLSNAELAKNGDPDALLALAILASGDTRTRAGFDQIRNKIQQFVERLKPALAQEKNLWLKGFQLHSAMHDEFFAANSAKGELKGYRANQSQFTRIFRNKTYNCISSSLLYLILARYFTLPVEGVVLPSHSFVQLSTPEGKVIEIETTSKTGYGIRHNQAYYKNSAQHWSQIRNLYPATYEDYLKRKIVSAYQLIADNMNHQHTAENLLPQADRFRLQEIRGWLLPEDAQAQLFRLYVFNNELIQLKEQRRYEAARKLIKAAEHLIEHYSQALESGKTLDKRVYSIITFLYSSRANIAFAEEDYAAAVGSFIKALHWVRDQAQAAQIERNISVAYLNQGNAFFSKKDYPSAISFYEQAYSAFSSQEENTDTELRQKIKHNIGSAYWNMAVPYLNAGNSYAAHELLNQCRIKHPEVKKCLQGINDICQSYSLPGCQQ